MENTPARFKFTPNPKADGSDEIQTIHALGRRAVTKHDNIIRKMAEKHDTDPDLIRAIMYSENARGHKGPLNWAADATGLSGSVRPMNINPKMWGPLVSKTPTRLDNASENIEAATVLIKRISERLEKPTPAAIGSIYNYLGREKTSGAGANIGNVYANKPWKKN